MISTDNGTIEILTPSMNATLGNASGATVRCYCTILLEHEEFTNTCYGNL